jgi:hypothetical protein
MMINEVNNYVTSLGYPIKLLLRRTLVLPVLYSPLSIDHSQS